MERSLPFMKPAILTIFADEDKSKKYGDLVRRKSI